MIANYLKSSGLSKEVYRADVRAVVENARCVLDLASLALKLKEFGSSHIQVAAVEFPKFKEAIQKVPIVSLMSVPMDEIKIQYRVFLERLAAMTSKLSKEQLCKIDSKDLIMKFFDPAEQEFENVVMIMQLF